MSLYRKATPGELVAVVNRVVNAPEVINEVVNEVVNATRHGKYADKPKRAAYQREWMRAKRRAAHTEAS